MPRIMVAITVEKSSGKKKEAEILARSAAIQV